MARADGCVYMITGKINPVCYKCICRACGQATCPHRDYKYKRCFGVCMRKKEYRPILDCKNFYLKCFPKYKIRRVYKRPQLRYVDKTNADDIRVMLSEILRLLRPESAAANADINCIKHECICVKCPLSDKCMERCGLCKDYKGQNPVRLCARRAQFLRG